MKLRAWSIRRWVLMIAGIIILGLVGLRLRLRLKWEVYKAIAGLHQAGLPTNWRELDEFYGRIPESLNAAPLLTNAYTLLFASNSIENLKLPVVGWSPCRRSIIPGRKK